MSTSANSPAEAQPASPGTPPRPVPPQTPSGPSRRRWWWVAAGAAALVLIGWAVRPNSVTKQASSAPGVKTTRVAAGTLSRTLRVAGTTSARRFANIVAPMMRGPDAGRALVLVFLAKSGSYVKKGELIAQIDAQSVKDHVEDVESQIVQADADIRKRQAELAIELENLRQNIRVAKATLDKAKLDAQATEIRTPVDQELLKISADQAEAQYKQLVQDLATTELRQKSDLRLLQIAKERQVRHRERHAADVEHFSMKSTINGLFVMQTIFRGGDMAQIQVGDQVAPGQPFAKVVDPASMQLEATVNQTASEFIRLGQSATVTFDAFPGLTLNGKVDAIGALATGGRLQNYYIRNIPVRLSFQSSDPRVIPDLSAGADIVISAKDGGVIVPREAVQMADGKTAVYVKTAGGFSLREVELGDVNNTQAAVRSGLKEGEEIALQAPLLNR